MIITRKHQHTATIIFLTKIYFNIEKNNFSIDNLKVFENFENLDDSQLSILLDEVISDLKELHLLTTAKKNPSKMHATYINITLSATGKILMDKIYQDENKFMYDNTKIDLRETVISKLKNNGIDTFIETVIYTIKNLPDIINKLSS